MDLLKTMFDDWNDGDVYYDGLDMCDRTDRPVSWNSEYRENFVDHQHFYFSASQYCETGILQILPCLRHENVTIYCFHNHLNVFVQGSDDGHCLYGFARTAVYERLRELYPDHELFREEPIFWS